MKGKSVFILSIVLLLVLGIMMLALSTMNDLSTELPSGNGGVADNDTNGNEQEEEEEGDSVNVGVTEEDTSDITGFTMLSAMDLRLHNVFEESGVRTRVYITDSIKAALDENREKYSVKTMYFPVDFLDSVGYVAGQEDFDFLAVLEENGFSPMVITATDYAQDLSGRYFFDSSIYGLAPRLVNRKMAAISFFETVNDDGSVTRQYASFRDGKDIVSSAECMGYLAAKRLSTDYDLYYYNVKYSSSVAILRVILNYSADISSGVEPSLENSITGYTLTTDLMDISTAVRTNLYTFECSVGDSFDINASCVPEFEDLPIYMSIPKIDRNVLAIENGKLVAKSAGTGELFMAIGDHTISFLVTVS